MDSTTCPSEEELTRVCEHCHSTIKPAEFEVLGRIRRCPGQCPICFPKELAAEAERKDAQEREKRLDRYRRAFPPDLGDYVAATLENFEARLGSENAVRLAKHYVSQLPGPNPCSLVIWGTPGNGKSHLGAAVAAEGRTLQLATVWLDIHTWLRSIGTLESGPREDLIRLASRADLLVLDDLGRERMTGPRAEWLGTIIDARYRYRRCTVVTSNLGLNSLAKALTPPPEPGMDLDFLGGTRIVDRLVEMATVVENKATSFRQEKARRRKLQEGDDGRAG